MIKKTGNNAYVLNLPTYLSCLHLIFNVSLLEPYHDPSSFCPHTKLAPFKLDDDPVLSIKSVLDSWKINHYYEYYVQWKNQPESENSWVPMSNIPTTDNKLINCFHWWHPHAPCPHPITLSKPQSQLEEEILENPAPSVHQCPMRSLSSPAASQPSYYIAPDQMTTRTGHISCPETKYDLVIQWDRKS